MFSWRNDRVRRAIVQGRALGPTKSLSPQPIAGVRMVGSWTPSASTSRCASGIPAYYMRPIGGCSAGPEHAEKFRMRFGGERFNPKDRGRGSNWVRWYKDG